MLADAARPERGSDGLRGGRRQATRSTAPRAPERDALASASREPLSFPTPAARRHRLLDRTHRPTWLRLARISCAGALRALPAAYDHPDVSCTGGRHRCLLLHPSSSTSAASARCAFRDAARSLSSRTGGSSRWTPIRRTRPARRSAPRVARRRSSSITRTGCSIRCSARARRATRTRAGSGSAGTRRSRLTAERLREIAQRAWARERRVRVRLAVHVGDRRRARLDRAAAPRVRQPELLHVDGAVRLGPLHGELVRVRCGRSRRVHAGHRSVPAASCSGATTRSFARIAHATATVAALKRGARLIVVDPRDAGMAKKADIWLRVRPGTDGALALGIAHVMIERGWFDEAFVRDWTNGPLLVRADTGRLLRQSDLVPQGDPKKYVAWNERRGEPVVYDPGSDRRRQPAEPGGTFEVATADGPVDCTPVFELTPSCAAGTRRRRSRRSAGSSPSRSSAPPSCSGTRGRSRTTPGAASSSRRTPPRLPERSAMLYALTGSFDAPAATCCSPPCLRRRRRRRSAAAGSSGPSRSGWPSGRWARPSASTRRGRALPRDPGGRAVPGARPGRLRRESAARPCRQSAGARGARGARLLRPRRPVHEPDRRAGRHRAAGGDAVRARGAEDRLRGRCRGAVAGAAAAAGGAAAGEARSDMEIVFDLAYASGLASTSGTATSRRRYRTSSARPGSRSRRCGRNRRACGCRSRRATASSKPTANGFGTPTRRIELYSETFLDHGYPPLPDYVEPLVRPARPDLAERFPLILTCAKTTLFCESQHRALPSLRRRSLHPEVVLHPECGRRARHRRGRLGSIETPEGRVRAQAESTHAGAGCRLRPARLVAGVPGDRRARLRPVRAQGANFNLIIGHDAIDPVSGSAPLRSYLRDPAVG